MQKIHMTRQYLVLSGPPDNLKNIFKYGLDECVHKIPGLYRFSFGHYIDVWIYVTYSIL